MTDAVWKNRTWFYSSTMGTADFTESTARVGYRNLTNAGYTNGQRVPYSAENSDRTEWETGLGTWNSGTGKLERTTVRQSSAGGTTKCTFTENPLILVDALAEELADLIPLTYLDTDVTLAANSDTKIATQKAAKAYVDGLIAAVEANLGNRSRVRAATTANITIATALNNGDTLDGVTLATGNLVLVKNQSAPEQNGIYVVGVSPARSSQFDTYDEYPGSLIIVEEGTAGADTMWFCTSNLGGTLNTTAITFSQLGPFVNKAGDVMTGGLQLAYTDPAIIFNTGAGDQSSYFQFYRNSSARWLFGKSAGTESGSNAGSDFVLNRYSDAGSFIDVPLSISRATGVVSLMGQPARKRLSGPVTYCVGYDVGVGTVTIATPGVWSKTSHGLSVGAGVSFSILPQTKTVTISVASPGVVTWVAHGHAAGQPIKFLSTGNLPTGITAGTTYYVIATGLATDTFQFSATPGGAAVNTSAPTFTVTIASPGVFTKTAHGYSVGNSVFFSTTGALPTGLTAGTRYYVKTVPTADTFTVALTPEGSVINTSGGQSGTHSLAQGGAHLGERTGALPTGLTAGAIYWVIAAGFTANAFQVSLTPGGAAINTSGSQSGIFNIMTGNNSNDGLTNSIAGALFTQQRAFDLICGDLDTSGWDITIQMANGHHTSGVTITKDWIGGGTITVAGNATTPENVLVACTTFCYSAQVPFSGRFWVKDVKAQTTTAGHIIHCNSPGCYIIFGNINFGAVATNYSHIYCDAPGSQIVCSVAAYRITGTATCHWMMYGGAGLSVRGATVSVYNVAFSYSFALAQGPCYLFIDLNTFTGNATGTRHVGSGNSVLNSGGASEASYLPGNSAGSRTTGSEWI